MKIYTSKSNAKRAAKKLDIPFTIEKIADKQFVISALVEDVVEPVEVEAPIEVIEEEAIIEEAIIEVEVAPVVETPVEEDNRKLANIIRVSRIGSPCLVVWNIADHFNARTEPLRRKDVIKACEKAGIAFYTARTQYQLWKKATFIES